MKLKIFFAFLILLTAGVMFITACGPTTPSSPGSNATATNTPLCSTSTATATPNTANTVAGSVTISGITATTAKPVVVEAIDLGGGGAGSPPMQVFTSGSSPFQYTIGLPSSGGPYVMVAYANKAGDSKSNLHVGDIVGAYGTTGCALGAGISFIPSGAVTESFNVSTSNLSLGLHGTLTYTGAAVTQVNGCNTIHMNLFSDSGFSTNVGGMTSGGNTKNGIRYDALPYQAAMCSGQVVYVQAWIDASGYSGSIQTGDSFVTFGPVTSSSAVSNISFGDSNVW